MAMACRSCRQQLAQLSRQAGAAPSSAMIAGQQAGRYLSTSTSSTTSRHTSAPSRTPVSQQQRQLSSTAQRQGLRDAIGKMMSRQTEPYRVISATENIYKACATQADYKISQEDRQNDTIPKTADGEDLGTGSGMWHKEFQLPPTFSTWSQVTMLHLYLLFARLRNLEPEAAKQWQAQLVDHYFFDAEERMDLQHGITSRGLRQKYLKDLFIQWRGVIAAYDEGLVKGDAVLAAAVWRNVFKASPDADVRAVAAIVSWMRACLRQLDGTPDDFLFTHSVQALMKRPANGEFEVVDLPTKQMEVELGPATPAQKAKAETVPEIV
ncbi:ubiquinol-cytochrome C chaperone-domain-containing protein [Microdochium trichocladiopsis]|uniref:Ubiquinol-cytochrome C chaperone-domain-containing protein n=1 Tax=Microdochium trichocladiopsis TaxID=1682393 RepID=A0A9P8YEN7_9PEZI|nr:ubiquinol-cytochrome C chaperone-domain-containing protein [Microdochium trichocladiopsis]KAH7037849.1 ubiquinol-cytochrome C chaperone-domain-containing protein [Microdochium trichocladiopsis]